MTIETEIIAKLNTVVSVPVKGDVPKRRTEAFVTVERTGGSLNRVVVDVALVAVQSWAKTRAQAMNLAEAVDTAMLSLPALSSKITRCERNSGPYNFPDADGDMGRYQAIYDITFYKEVTQ